MKAPKEKREVVVDEDAKRQKKARDEDAAFGTYGGDLGVSYRHTILHTDHTRFNHIRQTQSQHQPALPKARPSGVAQRSAPDARD